MNYLEVDDNKEDQHSSQETVQVGQLGSVESLL